MLLQSLAPIYRFYRNRLQRRKHFCGPVLAHSRAVSPAVAAFRGRHSGDRHSGDGIPGTVTALRRPRSAGTRRSPLSPRQPPFRRSPGHGHRSGHPHPIIKPSSGNGTADVMLHPAAPGGRRSGSATSITSSSPAVRVMLDVESHLRTSHLLRKPCALCGDGDALSTRVQLVKARA